MNTFLQRVGFVAQLVVSLIVLAGFFGTLSVLLFVPADIMPAVRDVLLVLVGVLAGSFKDVVGYWVGSSHGSTLKTAATIEQHENRSH